MRLKKLVFIGICGILLFGGMVKVMGQASTGQRVFPWWNYDPQLKLWTFEELKNEKKMLEKLADEFNSAYKTNAAVAIRVRTQLYTLDETDPKKQVFAVIVVTGVLKEDIKP